jgi:hypothetical protein
MNYNEAKTQLQEEAERGYPGKAEWHYRPEYNIRYEMEFFLSRAAALAVEVDRLQTELAKTKEMKQ